MFCSLSNAAIKSPLAAGLWRHGYQYNRIERDRSRSRRRYDFYTYTQLASPLTSVFFPTTEPQAAQLSYW